MPQRKPQGKPQGLPQQMPQCEGQGKPQALGIPYSLSLSLLPSTVPNWSPFVVRSPGRAAVNPSPVETRNDVVEEQSRFVMAGRLRVVPAAVRWMSNIEMSPSGCWLWTGKLNPKGYARFRDGRRSVMVHRFAWESVNGPLPEGLEIGHLCHARHCSNPEHLRAMTHAENVRMRFELEGAPSASLGRPMTSTERSRRYRAKKRASRQRWAA